ncbi:cytochrome P450 family protein [Paraburkholderia xenovorans LB400]|uniref:Cytochrome P450 n=1 Tax=Paraburkholderia xenovorans (strain LB400) TaxID=266265 RepID=Q13HB0_PARXL|nr:cytochrome P450 [Paraburkholderia xenovorans]ABE36529.1 Cytochrome P450 [Paraburkholderia xenovorans LB400]AIP34298.1 cytochrome P450 family protein [Paraburkholderia xenovorans LB400]
MSTTLENPMLDLEAAYHAVSDTYRGPDIDLQALCREMRHKNPVMKGDFVATHLGIPTNAGASAAKCEVTLFRYQDVLAVMRDATTFTNGFIAEGLGGFFDGLIILAMDGDAHRRARGLLQPVFMPETVNRWRPELDRVIREDFLAPLVPNRHADLMDFGLYFPIREMYALMGFPTDDTAKFNQYATWALAMVAGNQIDPGKIRIFGPIAAAAVKHLYDAVMEVVLQRRAAGADGNDLISRLMRAEYEGHKLDDHEVTTFVRSLLPAAGETTTRTFSSVITLLLERPALVERVRNDRSLIPRLIDEAVRYEPVATFKVRQAARDIEIGGVKVRSGGLVQCMVMSANRDEDVFENADTFDIDRKPKPSFGFGFGAHMCIGQFVAKIELQCAVNAILDLFPNVRLDPARPAPKIAGAQLRGAKSVPVIWD